LRTFSSFPHYLANYLRRAGTANYRGPIERSFDMDFTNEVIDRLLELAAIGGRVVELAMIGDRLEELVAQEEETNND
jgi:hypothetical protein